MEIWKHIIYPFFVEVYATAATPFVQTWRWKWGNTFFGSRFLLVVFVGPSKKKHINLAELCSAENTQLGQDFNLIGNRFSIILFQRPRLELEKSVWWWIWEFLDCWGDTFFVIYWPTISISLDMFFSSGFRSVLGPTSRSRRSWQWIKHGSFFGGDPFVDFHIIFYEVLLTSRWNPNARVNPLTKVAGLHWKYGSRGKLQQKWFLVYWLLQAAWDLRKNMEAKKSTPKWRVAHPRIHPPPLFGVPKCELSMFRFGPFCCLHPTLQQQLHGTSLAPGS